MAAKRRFTSTKPARAKGGASNKFLCPDCGFVARHAMGLGRHRSARHGVLSKRKTREQSKGRWLSRNDAATRAGVHYNTIRQWESAGLLRTMKRPRVRGSLVSVDDLERLVSGRRTGASAASPTVSGDGAAVSALERRLDALIDGLAQLVEAARTPRRGPGRPRGSKNAPARADGTRRPRKRGGRPSARAASRAKPRRAARAKRTPRTKPVPRAKRTPRTKPARARRATGGRGSRARRRG